MTTFSVRSIAVGAALLLGACGTSSGAESTSGHQPTYGDIQDGGDSPCGYDADVYEFCGNGKVLAPAPAGAAQVTFFDAIDSWNERQVAKYVLPAGLVGARLKKTTSEANRACGTYSKGDNTWVICRNYQSTTALYVDRMG